MEQGSRSELGPAGDNLVLEQSTGGNQGGQRKSVDEEAKEKTNSRQLEEVDTLVSNVLCCVR